VSPESQPRHVARALNALVNSWKWIAGVTLVVAVATAGILLFVPNTYTADTQFYPETKTEGMPSSVAGLAAQFGVTVGGAEPTQSPQFYAELAKSRTIMDRLLREVYPGGKREDARFSGGMKVIDLLRIKESDPLVREAYARQKLGGLISAPVDRRLGTVRITVRSEDREFAAWTANQLVRYLNEFNQQTRQSRGRNQRVFAEEREKAAAVDLRTRENELRSFYEQNRNWESAPRLRLEEDRLRREVQISTEVVSMLARQVESARLTEASDLPMLTVIDSATAPALKSGPLRRLTLMAVVGLVFAVLVALAILREYMPELRAELPELWELGASWRGRSIRKAS
jgi:uncharacterized protein involved in exopolysaccharide biosynthesis